MSLFLRQKTISISVYDTTLDHESIPNQCNINDNVSRLLFVECARRWSNNKKFITNGSNGNM